MRMLEILHRIHLEAGCNWKRRSELVTHSQSSPTSSRGGFDPQPPSAQAAAAPPHCGRLLAARTAAHQAVSISQQLPQHLR